MHPVLFHILGVPIYSFGVMMALAFLAGVGWAIRRGQRVGLTAEQLLTFGVWLMVSALLGARLTYILFFPQLFWQNPLEILLGSGGLVWYGGVAGGGLAIWGWCKTQRVPILKLLDVFSPPAALGLAIGRIGCFLAGCCYGATCDLPWAVHYPDEHITHGLAVHPAPLYETLTMALVALALGKVSLPSQPPYGRISGGFLVCAGFIRFALEYVRGDRLMVDTHDIMSLALSASQWISLGVILMGGFLLWRSQAGGTVSHQASASPPA